MPESPLVTQTQTALHQATDARRPGVRRTTDLSGYARALAEGLAYAHEQTA